MTGKTGVARLRQAIENQVAAGEACFSLTIGEVTAICDELEDELARFAWAESVPAPRDADGEVVPLDVMTFYTDEGEPLSCGSICFNGGWWYIKVMSGKVEAVKKLHLAEPDSWEKLEKDISKAAGEDICGYFGFILNKPCSAECPARDSHDSCAVVAVRDVMRRAKALAEHDAKETDRD